MKKLLSMILVICIAISLVACGGRNAAPGDETTTTAIETVEQSKDEIIKELSSYLTKKLSAKELNALPVANSSMTKDELRQLCIDYFELQLSFQWIPNVDITDWPATYAAASKTIDFGSVYSGIPYQSEATGNLYRWLEYYDEETGVFDIEKAFAENGGSKNTDIKKDANGNITYYKRLCMLIFFNQCSVASYWGFGRVINSADYSWTYNMNVNHGFIPVGDYTYGYEYNGKYYDAKTIDEFGKKTPNNPKKYDVKDVIADWKKANGADAMHKCYAQMLPADLIVSGGHARMIRSVNVVYKNDGVTIDSAKSYAIVLEQVEPWGKSTSIGSGTPYHQQGYTKKQYTFNQLESSGYIPFTFAEFLEEDDPRIAKYAIDIESRYNTFAEQVKGKSGAGVEKAETYCTVETGTKITAADFAKMVVGSNYSISDAFVNVKDAQGKVVHSNVFRALSADIREVEMTAQHASWKTLATISDGVEDFSKGGYTVEVLLQLSNGEKLTAFSGELIPG